ncbi:hypothetical protein ACO2Q8_24115 [Larkinella sp. VNQ87]|uniref:hypothetical protein n=1 Tax=Larkinella sp. VNQ87 TaxID=3400921 RepID=UPI003C02E378
MTTIQFKIDDELLAEYGLRAVQEQFQRQLDWEALRLKALKLKTDLDEAGLDYDEIAKEARARAWEKYKNTVLKDVLPPEAFE